MKSLVLALAVIAGVVALAIGIGAIPRSEPADKYHAPQRSGAYSFDVYVDAGTIHVVLADYDGDSKTPELLYRRSEDGGAGWSQPVRVDGDATPAYLPYRGVDPQIAAAGERVVVSWTTAGDDVYGYGTGPLATAFSSDGGASWRVGPNPSDEASTLAHEFIDMTSDAEGGLHLVWIDDRDESRGVRRGLRHARSTDGGASWSENHTIDEHICGCCWTHVRARDDGSLFLLYRDEHPAPSDMRLAVSLDAGRAWEQRSVVGRFDWMQRGCPHTTGGLAWSGEGDTQRLHAVVQTGKERLEGIYYLASDDEGHTWSDPHRIVGNEGHYADLAANEDSVALVWQEQRGTRTAIVGVVSKDSGRSFGRPALVSDTTASAAFPRVVAAEDGFRVFWTESEDGAAHAWSSVELGADPY